MSRLCEFIDYGVECVFDKGSSNVLGNMLVLSGAVLYGISNVGQEMMVSRYGTLEYLGSYSFFASFISGTQLYETFIYSQIVNIFLVSKEFCLNLSYE